MAVSSEILATSGQTVVDTGLALPSSKNDFLVFVNNVLADVDSYERTSDSEITFNEPLVENDKIRTLVPFTNPTSCSTNIIFPDSPTLSELRTLVRKEMKVDRNGRIWDNDSVDDAINLAILNVQKATNFGWQVNDACQTIQTVAWQETYTLADNTQGIELVEYDKDALSTTNKIEVEALNKDLPSWTPRYYYVWNWSLGLSPIPTQSNVDIKVYYQKFLVPLQDDTDQLPFQGSFTKAVILYASYDLFAQTSDSTNLQRANVKLERYKWELNTIRLAYLIPDRGQVEYKTTYTSPSRRWTTNARSRYLTD